MKVWFYNDSGEFVEEECKLIIDGQEYEDFADHWYATLPNTHRMASGPVYLPTPRRMEPGGPI